MRNSVLLLGSLTLLGTVSVAQTTTRESVGPLGAQANGTSEANLALSADGWYVAFTSRAGNLVPNDTNGAEDVFVRDRRSAVTERVSVSSAGAQSTGSGGSFPSHPSISGDGRYVVFETAAGDLVPGDTNGYADVFLRDRLLGTTQRVSVSSSGAQADGWSARPSISADGRFVAFTSAASDLVVGDTNPGTDIFVHDLTSGTTQLVSSSQLGGPANGGSDSVALSADGRFVAFSSAANNLVGGDTNGYRDVFVRDRLLGTNQLVSISYANSPANYDTGFPAISADGRIVVFEGYASNLVANDTNGWGDVFLRDRSVGVTTRISLDPLGAQTHGASGSASISADGRFVAFESAATDLVAGDTNGVVDIFLHDRTLGATTRMSVNTSLAQGNLASAAPSLSADGSRVAFLSYASNLVAGDTNLFPEFFVRDTTKSGVPYCSGDGSATGCPCGNSGAENSGCANSLGVGATLAASGAPSLSADQAVLFGSGLPSGTALYFQGTSRANGGLGVTFGDGVRCVGGTVVRLGLSLGSGGQSQYPSSGDPPVSVRGLITSPGTRDYQIWYRNAATFCTSATFNLSNGWEIAWEL